VQYCHVTVKDLQKSQVFICEEITEIWSHIYIHANTFYFFWLISDSRNDVGNSIPSIKKIKNLFSLSMFVLLYMISGNDD